MSELINFYELPRMQKFLPKYQDKQKALTGIDIESHIGIFGKTSSFKSNSLLNFIHLTSQNGGTFHKILMCVKKLESLNFYLKEGLEDKVWFFMNTDDFPSVSDFEDLSKENNKRFLIIFDDCITDTDKKSLKKMQDYMIYGRSKGCKVIHLSQSYYDYDMLIRRQLGYVLLCGISSKKELASIIRDYSFADLTQQQLLNMYSYCKQLSPCNFLKICCFQCPDDKKFSCAFLNYLNPADFQGPPEKEPKAKKEKKRIVKPPSHSSSESDESSR
jgi:hypothetical protein